jgi:hypothetical protein
MAELNVAKLRHLYSSNALVKKVFTTIAQRERPRPITDLRRLRLEMPDGASVDKREFADIFTELQRLGLGTLVLGRGANPDRFKWAYNMVDVARDVIRPGATSRSAPVAAVEPAEHEPFSGWHSLVYPLKSGEVVKMKLPAGLSREDAQGLADFIKRFGKS